MPTYEYRCHKCGIFEIDQSINDKPLTNCPDCGAEIKRVISSAGIVFKGSGFYVTDQRKDKPKDESKPKASKPAEKPKTENKPAEKPKETKSS
jgi:putative FmdB family regulatory protein